MVFRICHAIFQHLHYLLDTNKNRSSKLNIDTTDTKCNVWCYSHDTSCPTYCGTFVAANFEASSRWSSISLVLVLSFNVKIIFTIFCTFFDRGWYNFVYKLIANFDNHYKWYIMVLLLKHYEFQYSIRTFSRCLKWITRLCTNVGYIGFHFHS